MCGSKPCISSVFGLELRVAVVIIGVLELIVTIIATILNVVKYTKHFDDPVAYEEACADKDVCIGTYVAKISYKL